MYEIERVEDDLRKFLRKKTQKKTGIAMMNENATGGIDSNNKREGVRAYSRRKERGRGKGRLFWVGETIHS